MAGKAEQRAKQHITQLSFDSLTEVPADSATKNNGEVRRSAPPSRKKGKKSAPSPEGLTQGTLDALFATTPGEAHIPLARQTREIRRDNGQITQLDFDSLGEIPSDDVLGVQEREPAGSGTGSNGQSVRGPDVRIDNGQENGIFIGLGDSSRSISAARRRRVEPEPERKPTRDFRITEAHQVGIGSLHEKANANIAAIKLVKTLEAENRDATNEEKAILVRYAGWGALAGVFEGGYRRRREWHTVATELTELLTDEEYQSARATTPNAHFTSPLVIGAIWNGLEHLGIDKGADVLEPAMGVGHFFGLMPESMIGGQRIGVELDTLTARIARKLYPDTNIFAQGFEATPLPDAYFDTVVGNVPFGDYPVHDPNMRHSLTRSIHDYFFANIQLTEGSIETSYNSAQAYNSAYAVGDGSLIFSTGGDLYPSYDDSGQLGTSTNQFKTLNLSNASIDSNGNFTFNGGGTIGGNLTVNGAATISGNLSFGADTTDTIAFSGLINSSLIPATTNTYDLGSSSNYWNALYANTINSGGGKLAVDSNGKLTITYSGDSGSLSSSGGVIFVNSTSNTGNGIGIYSNAGASATGNLLNISAANANFGQAAIYTSYSGSSNAVEIVNNGTDSSSNALAVTGNNPNDSTLGIIGYENGRGTIKVTHNKNSGTDDSSASGISIDLKGSGTAAQGLYVDSTETGGTTGNLLRLRNESVDKFVVDYQGNLTLGNAQKINFKDTGGTARPALQYTSANNIQLLNFASSGNVQLGISNSSSTGNVQFFTNDTVERMRIASGGNVGIGTTSPLASFDVWANVGTVAIASVSGQSSFAALTVDNSGAGDVFTASSSGQNRFVIKQDGNVGIGTPTPGSLFDIKSVTTNVDVQRWMASDGSRLGRFTETSSGHGWFEVDNSSGTALFLLRADGGASYFNSGNVGIGDTSATNKLKVVGSLCVKDATGACAGNTSGTIYATNTTVQSADVAENYISAQKLTPGDIVIPANDGNNQAVVKTKHAYQSQTIGIVSTNPGVTLNSDAATDSAHPYLYPIALQGRIPVKVSSINGTIQTGDLLTSSSIPGVAMKATKAGQIIGKALESYNSTDTKAVGKVMVFVNISWADPTMQIALNENGDVHVNGEILGVGVQQSEPLPINTTSNISMEQFNNFTASISSQLIKLDDLSKQLAALEKTVHFNQTLQDISTQSAVLGTSNEDMTIGGKFNVLGRTLLTDVGITGKISNGLLTINGMDETAGTPSATINTLSVPLKIQSLATASVDFMNGRIIIDTNGNLKVDGEITAKKVKADKYEATDTGDAASVGDAIIPAGKTQVEVKTKSLTAKSKIFVEPEEPVTTGAKKTGEESFVIKIQPSQETELKVQWWIVN